MAGYIGSYGGIVAQSTQQKKIHVATLNQTVFGGNIYIVGYTEVFRNGVRLVSGTDYSAPDGINITLTSGAGLGDQIVVMSQSGFELTDALKKGGDIITGNISNNSSSHFQLPQGSESERPSSPLNGFIRYNTEINRYEGYSVSSWGQLGGGATGGGADEVFVLNSKTVTQDFTIPADKNSHSVGTITIEDGVTVTVPDGSTWVIS